jgi:arabinose-5-phosphate isomerase
MSEVMTPSPITVNTETMVVEVIKLVENRRIDDLVVVDDENKVAGVIDIQDLPGLKIM